MPILTKCLLLCLWQCAFLMSACAQTSPAEWAMKHAEFSQKMGALLPPEAEVKGTGLSISIHQNGQSVYQHHRGWANALQAQAVTANTPFELASVAKPFTAIAVLQLMERGELTLQVPVKRFVPELPVAWSTITLHHLLAHQSGIPDVLNEWPKKAMDQLTATQLIAYFQKNPTLKFTPGQRGDYSNTNYILLAEVVKRVTGQTWDAYLRSHIFEPLKMTSSFALDVEDALRQPHALHFAVSESIDGVHYKVPGAIGQKSSALDLNQFVQGLVQGQLIRPQSFELMTQVHTTFDDGRLYGYGWYVTQPELRSLWPWVTGGWALGHTGRLGAYRTALYLDRRNGWDLVVLGNGGKLTEELMLKVVALTRQYFEN
jgi:CubicO group peptidase (beta-lactamase class C family)